MEGQDKVAPWECVHIDMKGPWKIKYRLTKGSKSITIELLALTAVDIAATQSEFTIAHDQTALRNLIVFDKEWLCCYPRHL